MSVLKGSEDPSMSPNRDSSAKSSEQPVEERPNWEGGESAELGDQMDFAENEGEEDEEEDVDFNPLLKETPSRDASSSLSSEVDGLDTEVVESNANASGALEAESLEYLVSEAGPNEEILTQIADCSFEEHQEGIGTEVQFEKMDESGRLVNADNDLVAGEINTLEYARKPGMSTDEEDAICMRTRARYSLASFTLDELETFLQGSDDEDDFQNVDDEAEYRKFLAAVLRGDSETPGVQESENVDEEDDDEDEENDADFELELEEALESENDEDGRFDIQEETLEAHRPKTRQNRRKKASRGNEKLLGNRPLRPILPCVPIMQRPDFATLDRNPGTNITHNPALPYVNDGSINGFTPHQIGQLHCLIHEHVQLLIQVFSVCVLEPSKQDIALEVRELMSEMHHQRENVLAWRRLPYPDFCFLPPCIHPSVPNEILNSVPESSNRGGEASSIAEERRNETLGRSSWIPCTSGPVLSVLDVAPLKLVINFLNDVSTVVEEYRRQKMTRICHTLPEKEPLFPLINSPGGTEPSGVSSDNNGAPKRTMASLLVEKAKKQSVALVPKEIAQLAQRFYPLFNPALYPHKPPPAAVANRLLFTESEDELLALGIMAYNTDWKAIQERFLPCKSEHQIFVRQKNRSSSKAPDNPIKAVRRMKTSPLTFEEVSRIVEWMKVYKLDWMAIWKSVLPYRDPSLLPRQWRIAMGTQKSYKTDENKKAKRKLYDLRRRNGQSAPLASCHSSPEKAADKADEGNDTEDNQIEREEDEAYVHEAFLADWRPDTQPSFSSEIPAVARPMTNQAQWRPYRQRRHSNSRLVKLADDLPPVNLPPSARVLPQSAFTGSRAKGISPSFSDTPSGVTRIRVNASSSHLQPQKKAAAERKDDSDLQMHPLLFQAPGDGRFPYYQSHQSANTLSSLNFTARSRPQLSLSLYHHPHHARSAVNFPGHETDFHPLLKRSEAMNSAVQLSQYPETFGGQLCQAQNPLPVRSTEKTNELDLNIPLGFTSRRSKDVGSRESEDSSGEGFVDPSRIRIHNLNSSPILSCQNVAEDQNERITENADDDVEDQILPEIVMEQEELSDSEDEITEDVEFEREEMADSEAELESETEEMVDTQNEEDVADQHRTTSNTSEEMDLPRMEQQANDPCPNRILNLNFCPPESPLMVLDKEPSFSRKADESIDDHFRSQKKLGNLEMQSNVESSGFISSRKSRKRAFGEPSSNRKSRRLGSDTSLDK